MLSQQTIEIIKSTVPVLEVHGQTITSVFYKRMFEAHPELLHIFNQANQRQGKQSTALAGAVYAAAANIDQLENILPVVKQIAQKHRALQIKPEHYPIVGENLLAAIKEVLGEAATPEIMEAWRQAYGVIADVFISIEAEMYKEAEEAKGGWSGYRAFVVERKVKESEVITSFYLKPQDGGEITSYLPGQYITLRVQPEGSAYTHIRHYSLSAAPGGKVYRISVRREEAGEGKPAGVVSNYLHDQVLEGSVVDVSAPAGVFTLDQQRNTPVVLISGGVGLTPMVSMLETLLKEQPHRKVTYIHAAENGSYHAMKLYIEELEAEHEQMSSYTCYKNPLEGDSCHQTGYIDETWLRQIADPGADFYFCGPVPFMRTVYAALNQMGVPEDRIHYEFFGPAAQLQEA
ncbi:nitric oxide dioxygenase [Paenibacillus yonginensis]|uniref:Flavohemoprotein n=1 Tax=Paenibacillus yonginensis TaxID=1462996 RepID=A0A1B1N5J4_9BACL|nr:NO-inducible flavohemoprotein [Paenibacillus yonginensis]ANS76655.1 nitric oxide dioxygenase [Paenibacillus yonginensis]